MTKIRSKQLFVNVENTIKIGNNDAIEATLIHSVIAYETIDGEIDVDIDFIDIEDVKFLGIPVEGGYKGYNKFKAQMLELGINVDKLIDEKVEGITWLGLSPTIETETVNEVKRMFSKINRKCC
jgi:hypothetical protein